MAPSISSAARGRYGGCVIEARPAPSWSGWRHPPVGLDLVARSIRDQRGDDHCRWAGAAAELVQQTVQRRRIGNPAVLSDLAAPATLRHGDNDAFLVVIRHDPSPMHEARHRISDATLVPAYWPPRMDSGR